MLHFKAKNTKFDSGWNIDHTISETNKQY